MGAAQFFDLQTPMRISVGVATAAAAVVAVRLHVRARRFSHPRADALAPGASSPAGGKDIRFRVADTEAAFAEACRASQDAYGEANVSPDRTLKWWRRHPRAVLAAYCVMSESVPELAGQVFIWPLKAGPYERLRSGRMKEGELSHQSIATPTVDASCAHWYISNVLVHKSFRRSPLVPELLAQAIRTWSESGLIAERVHLLAFAYSADGEKLLRRFGFLMLRPRTSTEWPIFELELDRSDLPAALLSRLPTSNAVA